MWSIAVVGNSVSQLSRNIVFSVHHHVVSHGFNVRSSQDPTCTSHPACASIGLCLLLRRSFRHEPLQTKIPPCRLTRLVLCSLDSKRSMLIWDYVVLIVRIQWLVLGRNIDLFGGQLDAGEVLK